MGSGAIGSSAGGCSSNTLFSIEFSGSGAAVPFSGAGMAGAVSIVGGTSAGAAAGGGNSGDLALGLPLPSIGNVSGAGGWAGRFSMPGRPWSKPEPESKPGSIWKGIPESPGPVAGPSPTGGKKPPPGCGALGETNGSSLGNGSGLTPSGVGNGSKPTSAGNVMSGRSCGHWSPDRGPVTPISEVWLTARSARSRATFRYDSQSLDMIRESALPDNLCIAQPDRD